MNRDLFGSTAPIKAGPDPTGVRCTQCGKKLAEFAEGRWHIRCPRCRCDNYGGHPTTSAQK